MKAYMDLNRYRGSDKKNQQQHLEQTKPAKAKNSSVTSTASITQALSLKRPRHDALLEKLRNLKASDTPVSEAATFMAFFENFPVNGTNLCARPDVNLCDQFYTQVSDTSLVQGAYSLTSRVQSIGLVQKAVNSCGSETQLKAFFQSNLETSSQAVLGNATCLASAYSRGRTIHLDYQLSGVSPLMCSLLNDNFNQRVTPCVEKAVYNAFDAPVTVRPNASSSQGSSVHPIILLPLGAIVGASLSLTCILTRRMRERNNAAAQPVQNNPVLAQPQANNVNAQPVNMPAVLANNALPAAPSDAVAIEITEQRPRLSPR